MGVREEMLQRVPFVGSKASLLLFSHLLRGDFSQLVGAGFTDEDGNFVIGWLAAMLRGESLNCGVSLRAAHAVLFEQFIRDTTNLKPMIFAFGIAARLYFVSQTAHLTRQRVPVNLRQVCPPFIKPDACSAFQRPSTPSYVRLAATACVWSCGSSSRLVSWRYVATIQLAVVRSSLAPFSRTRVAEWLSASASVSRTALS